MTTTKRYVTFYSPGTLFAETSTVTVPLKATLKVIVKRAAAISERHGAKPYGFRIELTKESTLKRGGQIFKATPKTLSLSGMHYLTGRVLTLADIPDDTEHRILRSNMRGNGWNAVIENTNSYRSTTPFEADDMLLDREGNVTARGSDYYPKVAKP